MGAVNRVMIGPAGAVDLHVTSTTGYLRQASSGEGGMVQAQRCLTNG